MGLDFGDNDPATSLHDLDRVLDQGQFAVEREVDHGTANRNHPPLEFGYPLPSNSPASAHERYLARPEDTEKRSPGGGRKELAMDEFRIPVVPRPWNKGSLLGCVDEISTDDVFAIPLRNRA